MSHLTPVPSPPAPEPELLAHHVYALYRGVGEYALPALLLAPGAELAAVIGFCRLKEAAELVPLPPITLASTRDHLLAAIGAVQALTRGEVPDDQTLEGDDPKGAYGAMYSLAHQLGLLGCGGDPAQLDARLEDLRSSILAPEDPT